MKSYTSITPYITKNMDVSTTHITLKDNELLLKDECPVTRYKLDYGYLICILEFNEEKIALKEGFSKEFINLLKLARKNNCQYLHLDSDGITYNDLPTFNW